MKRWRAAVAMGLAGLLTGCSVLQPYPSQMQDTINAVNAGQMSLAIEQLPKPGPYNTELNNLELGRLQQLSGLYQASLTTFDKVIQPVEAQALAPKIQVSKLLSNTSAVLVNDNTIPYRLAGYEIVLLYQYQALNYLALGNEQNALVMMRKAQAAQKFLADQHYKELLQADEAKKQQSLSLPKEDYPAQYNDMMAASSQIKNSFYNPFSDYFASVLYAANGDINNAVVSLKNALEVAPDNRYLRQALLLSLQAQGNDSELQQYLKAFGDKAVPTVPTQAGTLVVIYEQSLIPAMQQIQVPIPLGNGILPMSFPYYDSNSFPIIRPLSVKLGANDLGTTSLLTNNALLAEKALVENYPFIVLRLVLRFATQGVGLAVAQHDNSSVASIGVVLYSLITSSADMRSWLTLPDNVQILQLPIAAGQYNLGLGSHSMSINVAVSKTTLIWVTESGLEWHVREFNL